MTKIPFLELKSQFLAIEPEIRAAIDAVFERSWFVLGEQVAAFEEEFAQYTGSAHAVGVGSGTDAIHLALRALGIGPGDEVITAANTCVPTLSGISASGATPVLVDADPQTLTLAPDVLEAAISPRTRAVVPVHLYGHPADMDAIGAVTEAHGIPLVEDCAQAHGAQYKGRVCGSLGALGAFSFYPSKNLGAYGDGGAVTTDSAELADKLRKLRNYGEDKRYFHTSYGVNSRLDELQAAILRVKLRSLDAWNAVRRELAARYQEALEGVPVTLPREAPWARHCYHLFVIRTPQRDALRAHLEECGIGTQLHYPVPIHLQEAYRHLGRELGAFPASEAACGEVISLPLYPELSTAAVDEVCRAVSGFFA